MSPELNEASGAIQGLLGMLKAAQKIQLILDEAVRAESLRTEREKALRDLGERIAEKQAELEALNGAHERRMLALDAAHADRERVLAAQIAREDTERQAKLDDFNRSLAEAKNRAEAALSALADQRQHLSDEVVHLEGEQSRLESIVAELRSRLGSV